MTKAKRVCPIKGSGGGSAEGAVSYAEEQSLTKIQKDRARGNIGAASEEEVSGKANNDGYYSKMTVGAAESIVGSNETSREFTEDTAGGTADIADGSVKIEKVKGNTIVWNQILTNSYTKYSSGINIVKNDSDDVYKINGTSNKQTTPSLIYKPNILTNGHKYFVNIFKYKKFDDDTNINVLNVYKGGSYTNVFDKQIFTANGTLFMVVLKSMNIGDVIHREFGCYLFDLTKMFGAGNEPATPEEFEKLFTLDYYDYNAGEILSLNPTGIKTVGFNAYNPATGKAYVIGGKQYQITGAYTSIAEGDTTITPDSSGIFTPTKNGDLTIAGGNSTTTCVHLVWSGVRNGEYEEHWEETRNIPINQINTDGTITESATGKTRLFPDGLCSVGESFDEVSKTKAIKRIGARAYEEGDDEDTSVITDGTITLYVLETPIEVTFAEPLNLNYRVSDFGTETLLPINGSEPATAPIKMDVVYGLNVVDFVRNADKNYLTIEDSTGDNGSSFTNLRSALSSAFGIDVVPTYDAANKRYTFTISDNRKVEVPESATASGLKGTWAEDATAVYFCTDTNVWVKIAKTNW